jgi:hypothetical protein
VRAIIYNYLWTSQWLPEHFHIISNITQISIYTTGKGPLKFSSTPSTFSSFPFIRFQHYLLPFLTIYFVHYVFLFNFKFMCKSPGFAPTTDDRPVWWRVRSCHGIRGGDTALKWPVGCIVYVFSTKSNSKILTSSLSLLTSEVYLNDLSVQYNRRDATCEYANSASMR